MLELLKRELKELPEWAMHALRVPQHKNQVINFKFKDIGSAVTGSKAGAERGNCDNATLKQSTPF